ncbi:hypothetical protein Ahy_B10g106358 [Arachis hypogaea]|uniref:R13L1/DRL21-like LRR repeat region domain-containing protein n=1 Tax=Arachis hypogaea TaxID=3818 RepID=A0A444XAJ2_ARAHY|nr:hypothetical protein Ahy_B10g106358 [Arachis hypogaea]
MAAAIVGGALLSASVQVLLDKIISSEFLDFFRRRKLNVSLLGKMQMKLKTRSLRLCLNRLSQKQQIGKLCISKLQKIVEPCDASQAKMKKKEQIEDLSLEWDSCTAQESQHLVLEHLQPSTNLNKVTIKFYGGTWFPNCLGTLLSASVQVLLDKIISNEFLDFFRRRKLNVSLLGKKKMKLKTMKIAEHAFGANNSSERSNLEGIGREIVKKFDGLPLAAVALGGLLRTKLSKNDWNKVLRSNIWDLPNLNVQPALLLRYLELAVV